MLVFTHAADHVVGGAREAFFIQRAQGLAHGFLVKIHNGIAIGFLVARVDERVQRKRIIFRRGQLFFDERAEHPGFHFG